MTVCMIAGSRFDRLPWKIWRQKSIVFFFYSGKQLRGQVLFWQAWSILSKNPPVDGAGSLSAWQSWRRNCISLWGGWNQFEYGRGHLMKFQHCNFFSQCHRYLHTVHTCVILLTCSSRFLPHVFLIHTVYRILSCHVFLIWSHIYLCLFWFSLFQLDTSSR